MTGVNTTPDRRENLATKSTITGQSEYLTSTNGFLNTNATVSISGSTIPIAGATTAIVTAIVDGSGNQITSFGGGTQYVNGASQATPTGTVALGYDGTNVRALLTTSTGAQVLGTGAATIGAISNTSFAATQATAASLNATVVGTGTFAVQATLSAETTKVIGTVNIAASQTIAVTNTGTFAVQAALGAGTNLIGKVGIDQTTPGTTNNVSVSITSGAGTSNLAKDDTQFGDAVTTGVLSASMRLYNGSTYDRARSAAGVTGATAAAGFTASGSALAAAPITAGGLAKTANPTAVSDAQVVNSLHDKLGKQVVVGSVRDLKANQVTTITASTAETTIVTAVASTFLDMYGLIITNTSATAVNVAIKDATAGTTRFNIAVPAADTRGFMLPEGGAIKQAVVNNNWTATSSGSVTSLVITALTVQNL